MGRQAEASLNRIGGPAGAWRTTPQSSRGRHGAAAGGQPPASPAQAPGAPPRSERPSTSRRPTTPSHFPAASLQSQLHPVPGRPAPATPSSRRHPTPEGKSTSAFPTMPLQPRKNFNPAQTLRNSAASAADIAKLGLGRFPVAQPAGPPRRRPACKAARARSPSAAEAPGLKKPPTQQQMTPARTVHPATFTPLARKAELAPLLPNQTSASGGRGERDPGDRGIGAPSPKITPRGPR